jgi:glycoside/pentoside/hexuronide:cation symporter, GPH family
MSSAAGPHILTQRLTLGGRIAWTLSAMPELLKSFAWEAFVLFYYAQVLGLRGGLIGLALAIILIFDALVDPYIGALSDRLRNAPLGRRHTLMAAAIVPFAIGLAAVFSPPAGLTQGGLFAWLLGFGLLARCGISFYTVPAFALGGELSRDERERNLIATLRNFGNQIVLLIVPVVAFQVFFAATPQFPRGQLNPAPYPSFGLFVAGLGAALMLAAVIGTYRRARAIEAADPSAPALKETGSPVAALFRRFFDAVRITPNIGRLLAVAFLVLVVSSTINQLSLHLATYYWKLDGGETQRLLLAGTVGSIIALAMSPFLMRRLSRRGLMTVGLIAFFCLLLLAILLPMTGLAPPAGTEAMGWFVFGVRLLSGMAYGLYVVPFNAIIYDISDEHEANTGQPQQGLVGSFNFIGIQAGSAITGLLAGLFLEMIAFPAGLPAEQMPSDKVAALAWFMAGLILVSGVIVTWAARGFRVSRQRQEQINAKLLELRSARAV